MNNNSQIAESQIFDLYPALEIEKIVFGYRISHNVKHKVANAIRKLAYQNLGISIGFEDSSFTNYFKNEIDLE